MMNIIPCTVLYRFKTGFGGIILHRIGSIDYQSLFCTRCTLQLKELEIFGIKIKNMEHLDVLSVLKYRAGYII